MHIELNGRRFVLKSFTNGQLKEMEEHDAREQDREKRGESYASAVRGLYGLTSEEWEAMPSRDTLILGRLTMSYSVGVPLAEIKILYAGEDGLFPVSGSDTAATAAES